MICLMILYRHYTNKKKKKNLHWIMLYWMRWERQAPPQHLLPMYTERDANKSRLRVNIHVKADIYMMNTKWKNSSWLNPTQPPLPLIHAHTHTYTHKHTCTHAHTLVHLSSHTLHSRHRCSMPQAGHDDSPHPFLSLNHMIRPLEPRPSTSTHGRFSRVKAKIWAKVSPPNLITSTEILFCFSW